MSSHALNWAKGIELRPAGAKLILLLLADLADEAGSCYPGQARLAKEACISERAVRQHLETLEQFGLIRKEARFLEGRRGRTSDRYYLNLEQPEADFHRKQTSTGSSVPAEEIDTTNRKQTSGSYIDDPLEDPPDYRSNGRSEDPSPKLKRTQTVEDDPDFREWYAAYPRHVGKGAARKAYRAARRKADAEILLAGARAARAQYAGTDPQFVPHPATWLNGERWLDEAPSANGQAPPKPQTDDDWLGWCLLLLDSGQWPEHLGARPTEADTACPFAVWQRAQRQHGQAA